MGTRASPSIWKGTVNKISRGHKGPFAIASTELGPVSFLLLEPVWKEAWPEKGIAVLLTDMQQKPKGWRAYKARIFRPEDEEFFKESGHYAWEPPRPS